jgi:putative resolvase
MVVVVEHRDRLARFGVEHLEAAQLLTCMCARPYGRRGARNRAIRAVAATEHPHAAAEMV